MNHNIENRPEDTAVAESVDTRNWVSPRVDIAEDFDGLRVVASLPGVIHEDIEVTFEQGVLKIRARVREADEDRAYRVREFAPGGYERSFRIRETVDASNPAGAIEATTVVLPGPVVSPDPSPIPVAEAVEVQSGTEVVTPTDKGDSEAAVELESAPKLERTAKPKRKARVHRSARKTSPDLDALFPN